MDKPNRYSDFLKVVLWSSLFPFLFFGCSSDVIEVCKVGDNVLTETELEDRIQLFYTDLEKEEAREKAIEDWVKQQQIYLEIQDASPEITMRNKLQMEEELFRLNLFELENFYIISNLDSTITEEEIQDYYDRHRGNYKAESYIVRALYVKLPDTVANVLNIDKYYLLENEKDKQEIKKFANLYATNFYFEEKRWIFFDDLVRGIPISSEERNNLIRNKGKLKFSENGETYYINILDYRTKSISSPMEVERDKIRTHILTRRMNNLRDKARETIVNNAKEKYPVTYY